MPAPSKPRDLRPGPSLDGLFADAPRRQGRGANRGTAFTPRQRRQWQLAAVLFALTVASTWHVGPWQYAVWVMVVLVVHEAGHWLVARRHGMAASPPYFIPFPIQPLGTLGAVIRLRRRMPHRRALFDIAVSGPLAGLVPALLLSGIGVARSSWTPAADNPWLRDESLLFELLGHWLLGPAPEGHTLLLHPLAMAGWVGIYITALNLIPIGQLDGGHMLYALLPQQAHTVSSMVVLLAAGISWFLGLWHWLLPLALLTLLGLRHPPTLQDIPAPGFARMFVGWLMVLFLVIGWSPRPFIVPG